MKYRVAIAHLLGGGLCALLLWGCSEDEPDGAPACPAGQNCMAMVMPPAPVPGMAPAGGAAVGSPTPQTPPMNPPPSTTAGSSGAAAPSAGMGAAGQPTMEPPVEQPPAMPSSGCGASEWPMSGEHMIDVDGTPRLYIVKIPDAYDANMPYRLIFAWHGLGGTAQQIASGFRGGYYGLETRAAGSAIFVAGQGLETMSGGAGWPNTGGRDIAFVRAMLDWLRASYCIDEERIFSTGMSYGGIMSNTVGCQLGDVFRAIAPIAGSGPRSFGGAMCVGQVAAWIAHGNMDTVVSFESGVASRDYWIGSNHCGMETMPVTPDGCVAYQGCDEGHPVHWCEHDGAHTVPTFASDGIWAFFSQF